MSKEMPPLQWRPLKADENKCLGRVLALNGSVGLFCCCGQFFFNERCRVVIWEKLAHSEKMISY